MDKKPALLYKTLVAGVIVLFIGVGIQPAFALENKSCSNISTIIFEKDNPNPITTEVYENSNCFVVGRSTRTLKLLSGFLSRIVCLGAFENFNFTDYPAVGCIYTKGSLGKWIYQGEFYGELGRIYRGIYEYFIGINNFNGIIIGGSFLFPNSIFIGYAKEVKITTKLPCKSN